MAVTLTTLSDEVRKVLVDRSDLNTLIDVWLNDAQLMLATQLRIREIETAATLVAVAAIRDPITNVVTATTDIYALPTDFWVPIYLKNSSKQDMQIKFKALDIVLLRQVEPVGDPDIVAIRGNTFIFRPAFNTADTIELTYTLKVPTMTASAPIVDMFLPDEFRRVLVMDTAAYAMHVVGEEDRAQAYVAIRDVELRKIGDQRGQEFLAREQGTILQWSGREGADASVTGIPR